jgi:hypothetical protein
MKTAAPARCLVSHAPTVQGSVGTVNHCGASATNAVSSPAPLPAPTPSRDPTIAVVHDWLDTWASSKQCLAQIVALYPHAEWHTGTL